jgi:hypothetical protein
MAIYSAAIVKVLPEPAEALYTVSAEFPIFCFFTLVKVGILFDGISIKSIFHNQTLDFKAL